jgi:serine/threonine protein kinase
MPSGTPGYMAPEVLKIFGSSQPQNDIFSLGVVLYMLLGSTKYCAKVPPLVASGPSASCD